MTREVLETLKEMLWVELKCILESDYEPEVRAQARVYLSMLDGIENDNELDEIFEFCGFEDCKA